MDFTTGCNANRLNKITKYRQLRPQREGGIWRIAETDIYLRFGYNETLF